MAAKKEFLALRFKFFKLLYFGGRKFFYLKKLFLGNADSVKLGYNIFVLPPFPLYLAIFS